MRNKFIHFTDSKLRPCKHVHSHQFTHFNPIILIIIIHFWNWRVLSKTTRFDASIKTKLPADPRLCSFIKLQIDGWGKANCRCVTNAVIIIIIDLLVRVY